MADQIEYLTSDVVSRIEKLCVDPDDKNLKDHCHGAYSNAVEHYEEMSWHVSGTKPAKLLEQQRPREDGETRKYRLDSYQPITKSTCKKALSIVYKIFNPKLFSIRYAEDTKATSLKEYTEGNYPRFNSILNYFANYILKRNVADPNAYILAQPLHLVDAAHTPKTGAERIQPFLTCYLSKDVFYVDSMTALFFVRYEKAEKQQNWYFQYVDGMRISNIVASKVNSQKVVITELMTYNHNFGELPIWQLGGEYSDQYDNAYESLFYPAVPFWNEAIMDHSDARGALRNHMHPQKWEYSEECEYVEDNKYACNNGYIFNESKGDKHKCPQCNGAGRKAVKSPYETYWVNSDKFKGGDSALSVQVPVGYVTVPTEPTVMMINERDKGLEKGLNALAMDVVNKIGENQSGVSKTIDRTELNDFLQKFADLYFDTHLPNTYKYFSWYMFLVESGGNKKSLENVQPEISKPTQFDIYSTADLTEQFKSAKEAKVNPSYLSVKQAEIQNKEFQTHPELLNKLNLELKLDPLAEVTTEDVSIMLMSGTITKETAIIHDNIRVFVARALEEDPKYIDKDYSEQMEVLKGYAHEVIDENKVSIETEFDSPGL